MTISNNDTILENAVSLSKDYRPNVTLLYYPMPFSLPLWRSEQQEALLMWKGMWKLLPQHRVTNHQVRPGVLPELKLIFETPEIRAPEKMAAPGWIRSY